MTVSKSQPQTLYDKIFNAHVVDVQEDNTSLIYIDRHLVHEVTSPQAFEGLRNAGRLVRRTDLTLATVDHNIPTTGDRKTFKSSETFIEEEDSRLQCTTLESNVKEFGVTYFGLSDKRQGIVHVIGPEQGFTLPGTTVVCGDSHTSTHGAFGALAFGIGTSEVEHVLATQTILQKKSKNMLIKVSGELLDGVTSKDVILHIIGVIGTAGGTGCVIEFAGSTIQQLSMESRMSICNMAIEGGARAGLIAPDEITFDYLKGRPLAPSAEHWDAAITYWNSLKADPGAVYDHTVEILAADIIPTITWGTSPEDVAPITGRVPDPASALSQGKKQSIERALAYMGLEPNIPLTSIQIDKVFIGSCTNSRIEDLRSAARVALGRKVASGVHAMVVPGSGLIKEQAEAEGLHKIFIDAGFEWREAGCSMCLGMNPDQLLPKERCASTSNRNFEGRQGPKGRTHLMSPAMAAAAAITGHLTDVRELMGANVQSKEILIQKQNAKSFLKPFDLPHAPTPSTRETNRSETCTSEPSGIPKFTVLKGIAAPLDVSNVDTDMLIPKQFLKTIKRTGLGQNLFYEIRFDAVTGVPNPDFVLNKEPYTKASILVSGENFGCGSSREHAPWALNDFGIRCIIAPSFADIFYNNCFKNGMLPVSLPHSQVDALMADAKNGQELKVSLEDQTVTRSNGESFAFDLGSFRKYCLINGLDDIGITLKLSDKIDNFEAHRSSVWPWLDGHHSQHVESKVAQPKQMDW